MFDTGTNTNKNLFFRAIENVEIIRPYAILGKELASSIVLTLTQSLNSHKGRGWQGIKPDPQKKIKLVDKNELKLKIYWPPPSSKVQTIGPSLWKCP